MNRTEWENELLETYSAKRDHPWIRYPEYAVFRHGSQKCFVFMMDLPRAKFGLQGDGAVTVINLKCDPVLIGPLLREPGFFPAYHMNKEHWITALLDGSIPDDKLRMLIDMSYQATAPKTRKTKRPEKD